MTTSSSYLETRKSSYAAQRAASQGAGITLVSHAGEYVASFDCAKHCAEVLGSRNEWVENCIVGITPIHLFRIPLAEMHSSLLKLSARFSVALVELVAEKDSTRFVLVWKIPANRRLELDPHASDEWVAETLTNKAEAFTQLSPSPAEPEPCTLTLEDF